MSYWLDVVRRLVRGGRPPYRGGSSGEPRYEARPGRQPPQRGPFEEAPYQARPGDEDPRRPPEGFLVWDDR